MAYQVKAEPGIKADPDAPGESPARFVDEDIYEDTHDLEFNTQEAYQRLYLARVPKYLWEEWDKLDDDAEIRLGTVRQSEEIVNGERRVKLQMLLRPDLSQHQHVPKLFTLDVTAEKVPNTFVFTEADLPGYKTRSKNKMDPATMNMPARLTRPKFDRPQGERQPYDKNKKFTPYFRKAIPKKTVLKGTVAHEVNCIAVVNDESKHFEALRNEEAKKPKAQTKYIGDADTTPGAIINPGTIAASSAFGGFIKNNNLKTKAKSQETKTARMPRNELLDLLWACFRRFKYWSMKALRAELRQPEAYLREVLEEIADLPKSGRFAMNWTLKPEYTNTQDIKYEMEEAAPGGAEFGAEGQDDGDESMADADDDDDEDIKFEDVPA